MDALLSLFGRKMGVEVCQGYPSFRSHRLFICSAASDPHICWPSTHHAFQRGGTADPLKDIALRL